MNDEAWDYSKFTKNRYRLLGSEVAYIFFAQVLVLAEEPNVLSKENFSVDYSCVWSNAVAGALD